MTGQQAESCCNPNSIRVSCNAGPPPFKHSSAGRKQLEQSGCAQVSELQGCDTHKSKAENAKAGFTNPAVDSTNTQTPYAGQWVVTSAAGATVATIRIDTQEQVWVNERLRSDLGSFTGLEVTSFSTRTRSLELACQRWLLPITRVNRNNTVHLNPSSAIERRPRLLQFPGNA
ncbi:hypothetical protein D3C81_1045150 [compost metagenome]